MTKATRVSLALTVALTLITFLPMIAFGIGLLLNGAFNCDIRDESGTVYGTCSEAQASVVYSLMIMPWLMLVTMPFVGIPAVVALIITLILWVRSLLRKKS